MQRALELAKLGAGNVSPNPMVGCVIVHQDRIIGEGSHRKYGEGHAEVNAINSVKDLSVLNKAQLYVTLEPCSHFGKTPPCADLIIKHQIPEVFVAVKDPNPLVAGNGIKKLENAGIKVKCGILENEATELNKRFFTAIQKQRPYIILKWAETADGFIARKNYDSKWISSAFSRTFVHKWRAEEDAIMVGTNTALKDNPQLNVRQWDGRNPTRVVIDRNLVLPDNLKFFDDSQNTILFHINGINPVQEHHKKFGVAIEGNFLEGVMQELFKRKLHSVIIEGGAQLLNAFIEQSLWDEAKVFKSKTLFSDGIKAPVLNQKGSVVLKSLEQSDTDYLMTYTNNL
ncbi:bifunctional diaminohydroxyphosphoribosylaminopyrimidine deaminase/5-amino-6-(5-phosphoribosylamino)uracil reductase RibD [Chondrinema litorale]|uniref:bifunctional diaminohydroxyphosphoribosylaminopyrimidine deaminase/5-amino-6-(5-phosphoribosylamino)uracil reductase RibD n=1 Tax=Chondrinema litorale TaxID=2994555 RepID=UPI002543D918|nr:bifunctional diaminohydroxyphosphoribosylaminopyrimidine deaminase/5-amino-6-(5-phosphoribosylamino)uracil reductase RibD [Chondrinema litorale]UZR94689.1 bifunctional diaminohydroxyphosphoribosylaminopyrimidine deaminase/5-amino-6-(5-phosphoribosylamino)uracil reductase RibD [Chondrinema litorale]